MSQHGFCGTFPNEDGVCPDPKLFRLHFSAAIEYYEASIAKMRAMNAKAGKKKQGMYGDLQLLFYLADPKIALLTNDQFSGDIKQYAADAYRRVRRTLTQHNKGA